MASNKQSSVRLYKEKPKVNRPGVVAKSKTSKNKGAANYKKPYVGQG